MIEMMYPVPPISIYKDTSTFRTISYFQMVLYSYWDGKET